MRLRDLEPQFIRHSTEMRKWTRIKEDGTREEVDGPRYVFEHVMLITQATGIIFLCPKCFHAAGERTGVHSVLCWAPGVPDDLSPGPGRWALHGTGYDDLSLVASSSSVQLEAGCRAHFFVESGAVRLV